MASLAQTQIEVPVPAIQASQRLVPILAEHGFSLADGCLPGASDLIFGSETKALRNALKGRARITDTGSGSSIEFRLDVAPGESKAFLDGRRNRATLQQLTDDAASRLT